MPEVTRSGADIDLHASLCLPTLWLARLAHATYQHLISICTSPYRVTRGCTRRHLPTSVHVDAQRDRSAGADGTENRELCARRQSSWSESCNLTALQTVLTRGDCERTYAPNSGDQDGV